MYWCCYPSCCCCRCCYYYHCQFVSTTVIIVSKPSLLLSFMPSNFRLSMLHGLLSCITHIYVCTYSYKSLHICYRYFLDRFHCDIKPYLYYIFIMYVMFDMNVYPQYPLSNMKFHHLMWSWYPILIILCPILSWSQYLDIFSVGSNKNQISQWVHNYNFITKWYYN